MKKRIIKSFILMMGIFTVGQIINTFSLALIENTVYADTTPIVSDAFFTISNLNSNAYISFREGKLAIYATDESCHNTPGAKIIISKKSTGATEGPFNPNTLTTYNQYVTQGSLLDVGDQITIDFLEDFPNQWVGGGDNKGKKGESIVYEVQADGKIKKKVQSGQGKAQVIYNVNTITPDDPTANPDFTVLIPSVYQLSDSNLKTAEQGEVSLKDAQYFSKDYAGDQTVNVSVTSAKDFKFDNGGEYKLVQEDGASLPSTVPLSKTATKSAVNALLTKAGSKAASTDTLTFNYNVSTTSGN